MKTSVEAGRIVGGCDRGSEASINMNYLFNMKNVFLTCISFGLVTVFSSVAAMAGLTNADVIKMTNAGLSDEVIVATLQSMSDNKFDTSVDGLIALKNSKVGEAVIKAMVSGERSSATQGSASAKQSGIGSDEIFLKEESHETRLLYRLAEVRSQARALGYGGVAVYNVLPGSSASLRIKSKKPSFLVAVPKNAQIQSYITLADFAVRKNGNREVMVGSGVTSFEYGVVKDRVVEIKVEPAGDQSRAKDGYVLYVITPARELKAGEYAFVVTPSQSGSPTGAPMGMGQVGSPCYDFGID